MAAFRPDNGHVPGLVRKNGSNTLPQMVLAKVRAEMIQAALQPRKPAFSLSSLRNSAGQAICPPRPLVTFSTLAFTPRNDSRIDINRLGALGADLDLAGALQVEHHEEGVGDRRADGKAGRRVGSRVAAPGT